MRNLSLIALMVLSLTSSAFAADRFNLRARYGLGYPMPPLPAASEASTTFDIPASEAAPAQAASPIDEAPIQKDAGYAHDNGGCNSCNGNGGYFNFSWFGGCCEQQNSCCAGIWDNYCSQKKSWCHHHHKARCCQPAPVCAPACNSCGGHGGWMNAGHFGHYRPNFNFGWGYGANNGCSTCNGGDTVYGKPGLESEIPAEGTPAPEAEPKPAPKLEPTPAPKPMAREAFRPFFFPSLNLMPTFGL